MKEELMLLRSTLFEQKSLKSLMKSSLKNMPTFFDEHTIETIRPWGMAVREIFYDSINFFMAKVCIQVIFMLYQEGVKIRNHALEFTDSQSHLESYPDQVGLLIMVYHIIAISICQTNYVISFVRKLWPKYEKMSVFIIQLNPSN